LSRRGHWPIQRSFALAAIKAGQMSARQNGPDDVLAVDVHAARRKPLHLGVRVVPWHLVVLGQRRFRRMRAWHESNNRARHPLDRSPHGAIVRRRVAIELNVEALVLRWISRIVRLGVGVALSV